MKSNPFSYRHWQRKEVMLESISWSDYPPDYFDEMKGVKVYVDRSSWRNYKKIGGINAIPMSRLRELCSTGNSVVKLGILSLKFTSMTLMWYTTG
jgi:hypothetical protein